MDLDFFRRGGFADSATAQLDYALLAATLQAVQSASAAAKAEALALAPEPVTGAGPPLADLLLGAPGWRAAAADQRGAFNFAQAERIGNAAATQMTSAFTFAF